MTIFLSKVIFFIEIVDYYRQPSTIIR